jgi:hypothetical protein
VILDGPGVVLLARLFVERVLNMPTLAALIRSESSANGAI